MANGRGNVTTYDVTEISSRVLSHSKRPPQRGQKHKPLQGHTSYFPKLETEMKDWDSRGGLLFPFSLYKLSLPRPRKR